MDRYFEVRRLDSNSALESALYISASVIFEEGDALESVAMLTNLMMDFA